MESYWGLNNKDIEDFLSFPMDIYLPSCNKRFRRYDFLKLTVLLESCFGQHGVV
jgi:hypothetical protein